MRHLLYYFNEQLQQIGYLLAKAKKAKKVQRSGIYKRVVKGNEYFYYRIRVDGRTKSVYLGTADSEAVIEAKNGQMRDALIKALEDDQNLIKGFLRQYRPYDLQSLEGSISKCLWDVQTDFIVDERVNELWNWRNADYQKNSAPYPEREIYAVDGTRIRSKGECIWYNDFQAEWVPARYDPVMKFINPKPGILGPGNMIWKSPDFLIKCIDGTYIIVEHLGFIMDDSYSEDFREKTQIYEANGFTLGVNYYVMSDDVNGGTDSRAIHEKVEEIKWKVYHGTGLKPPIMQW